jgi:hypothetical protein
LHPKLNYSGGILPQPRRIGAANPSIFCDPIATVSEISGAIISPLITTWQRCPTTIRLRAIVPKRELNERARGLT